MPAAVIARGLTCRPGRVELFVCAETWVETRIHRRLPVGAARSLVWICFMMQVAPQDDAGLNHGY